MTLEAASKAANVAGAVRSNRPVVRTKQSGAQYSAVVNTVVVVAGLGILRNVLTKKEHKQPTREFWIQVAILGFVLSLLAETVPRLGKGMAYLIMTAAIFGQSAEIFDALNAGSKTPKGASLPNVAPLPTPLTPAAARQGAYLQAQQAPMIGIPITGVQPASAYRQDIQRPGVFVND